MRHLRFVVALSLSAAMAQNSPNLEWPQQPNGFGGLKFGSSKAEIEKLHRLECGTEEVREKSYFARIPRLPPAQADPQETSCITHIDAWGIQVEAFVTFRSNALAYIHITYPASYYLTLKADLLKVYGPTKQAFQSRYPTGHEVQTETLSWFSTEVFASLQSDNPSTLGKDGSGRPYDVGVFFIAQYEYLKDTGYEKRMRDPVSAKGQLYQFTPAMRVIDTHPVSVAATSSTLVFKFKDGRTLTYPKHPIDIGQLRCSYTKLGDDNYKYEYVFDNRQVTQVSVGNVFQCCNFAVDTVREGQMRRPGRDPVFVSWPALSPLDQPQLVERAQNAKYTLLSPYSPGLVHMTLRSEDTEAPDVPVDLDEESRQFVGETVAQDARTVQRLVIGPAFGGVTRMKVLNEVHRWIYDEGFTFLKPLFQVGVGMDPKPTLDTLSPSTELERQIVACLRDIL